MVKTNFLSAEMISTFHHQELRDVLDRADYITGPFVGPEGREWKVLAEKIGRKPIKCFEVSLGSTRIEVSPGVVHNVYYPETTLPLLRPGVVWLTYTATFAVSSVDYGYGPIEYRLPGPQSVTAAIIRLALGEEPVHSNDGATPSYLTNARKLATITRENAKWKLEGGLGIHPVTISALGGFTL